MKEPINDDDWTPEGFIDFMLILGVLILVASLTISAVYLW